MPVSPYASKLISEYLEKAGRRGRLSEGAAADYRRVLRKISTLLDDADLEHLPRRVGELEVDYIRRDMFPDAKPETVRWYLSIFNGYMKFYGNQTVQKMMLAWPQNVRTHIDWLSPQEAVALIRHAKGVERMVVHLELRLWFRRVEVRRLRTADIKEDLLDVRGKGRCGGKWRSVAWGPDTMAALMEWDREREAMVERAQKYDSMAEPPETWLFYQRGRKLAAYGDTAIDNIVSSAANRSGIDRPVTNHTLRRTGGRLAFYAGVSLEEICEGMGHSNTKQTIRYLGLQVDDLKRAQEKIYQYLLSVGGEMPPGMKLPTPGRRISR